MKCCGVFTIISSENIFCDRCNTIYPLYEEDLINFSLNEEYEYFNSEKNGYNIYEEYISRNYVPLKTKLDIESKLKFIKSCIYSKDCQIMSIIFISVSMHDKLIPIKYFYTHSGLMCEYNMFKKCVGYFIKLLSISINYDYKKLILFYMEYFDFKYENVNVIYNRICKTCDFSDNLFINVPIAILLSINNSEDKKNIKLMSKISHISLSNLKKRYKMIKTYINKHV